MEIKDKKAPTPFPPYHKVPNSIYEVELNHYEIVIYGYLSRRTGRHGVAYPKLDTICKETGIRSKGTVRKALSSLKERGFIKMVLPATHRSPARYKVCPFEVDAAAKSMALGNEKLDAPELVGESPEPRGEKNSSQGGSSDEPQRYIESIPEVHRVNPRGTQGIPEGINLLKEDVVKEDSVKDSPPSIAPPPQGGRALVFSNENTLSRASELDNKSKRVISIGGSRMNDNKRPEKPLLVESNEYYYGLSEEERYIFDWWARKLHNSESKPSLIETRELRQNFYGLMNFANSTYYPDVVEVELATQALEDARATKAIEGKVAFA